MANDLQFDVLIIGGGAGFFYILIFSLPVFSSNPSGLVIPAAIFIAAAAFCAGGRAAATPLLPLKAGNGVGYTVPQQIRMENTGDGVPVFFRVRAVYRDAKIVVRDAEGTQIAAFPREHLAPGEMETIRLPRVLLQKAAGALKVEIEKGGEGA